MVPPRFVGVDAGQLETGAIVGLAVPHVDAPSIIQALAAVGIDDHEILLRHQQPAQVFR